MEIPEKSIELLKLLGAGTLRLLNDAARVVIAIAPFLIADHPSSPDFMKLLAYYGLYLGGVSTVLGLNLNHKTYR